MNKQSICKVFTHKSEINSLGCHACRMKVLQYSSHIYKEIFFPMPQGNAIKSNSSMIIIMPQARKCECGTKEYLHKMHCKLNFSWLFYFSSDLLMIEADAQVRDFFVIPAVDTF